jgi:hypothetical protein
MRKPILLLAIVRAHHSPAPFLISLAETARDG